MNRLRVYAQLVRLPNLPTALADVCLAALALAGQPPAGRLADGFPWGVFALLLLASGLLYSSGMVWNDFFDQEQDRRERPFRPLPSGRARPGEAAWVGAGLMAGGVACAFAAGPVSLWLALALPRPVRGERPAASVLFPYLLVVLGFLIGLPVSRAVASPTPAHVQSAVKRCLLGLVVLDAVAATALAGSAGLLILTLLL